MIPKTKQDLLDPPAQGYARVISLYHPDGKLATATITSDNQVATRSIGKIGLNPTKLANDWSGRTAVKTHASALDAAKALKSHLNRRHAEGYLIFDVSVAPIRTSRKVLHEYTAIQTYSDFNERGVCSAHLTGGIEVTKFWKVTTRKPKGTGSPIPPGTPSTTVAVDDRALALVADFTNGRADAFTTMTKIVELRGLIQDIETKVARANELVASLELDVMNAYVNGGSQ